MRPDQSRSRAFHAHPNGGTLFILMRLPSLFSPLVLLFHELMTLLLRVRERPARRKPEDILPIYWLQSIFEARAALVGQPGVHEPFSQLIR